MSNLTQPSEFTSTKYYDNLPMPGTGNSKTRTVTYIAGAENIDDSPEYADCLGCGKRFKQGKNRDFCIECLMGAI
jgi:hypothetical protein